jgi:hypothetical protein
VLGEIKVVMGYLQGDETQQEDPLTTEDIILHTFCLVDDLSPKITKHPQAKLYSDELVTIGIFLSLKGGFFQGNFQPAD